MQQVCIISFSFPKLHLPKPVSRLPLPHEARRGISPDPDQLWNGHKTMRIYFPSPGRVPFIEPIRKEGYPSNAIPYLFLPSKWGEQGTHKPLHKFQSTLPRGERLLKNKDRYSQFVSVFVDSKYLSGHQANNLAINPVMMPHNEKS